MRLKAGTTISQIQSAMGSVDSTINRHLSDARKDDMAKAFGGMKSAEAKPSRGRKLGL